MDDQVLAALAKWPNVPHCYDWLSLDRRGQWRLGGEILHHPALIDFIRRNYLSDEKGCWFFQNGPQRVYVRLAAAPWVIHLDAQGQMRTHTQVAVEAPEDAWLDADGNLFLNWAQGAALIDDRDLATLLTAITTPAGQPATDAELESLMAGEDGQLLLSWQSTQIPLRALTNPACLKPFIAQPMPKPAE